MNAKRKLQIAADVLMTLMLPLLMAYSLIGETTHEWTGVSMFALFILHHLLNHKWISSVFIGRYTKKRVLVTITDALLFVDMLMLMISGIVISKHIFSFLKVSGGMSFARTLHLLSAYWGFVLMSIHLGIHLTQPANVLSKTVHRKLSCFKTIVGIISVYGIYKFISIGIWKYMLLINEFVFFDFSKPIVIFLLDYAAVMVSFAVIGYYINKIITKNRKVDKL